MKMLSECRDFKADVVDKLNADVLRIATGEKGNSTTSSVPSASSTDAVGVAMPSDGFSTGSLEPCNMSVTTNGMSAAGQLERDDRDCGDDEFTSSSFGTIGEEDSCSLSRFGCDQSSSCAAALTAARGGGPSETVPSKADEWPFNKENWDTDDDDTSSSPYLHGDKLLLCGALMVQQLRRDVMRECGYTCSGGIAHSKILSKVLLVGWCLAYYFVMFCVECKFMFTV
jgi:hypothetical protein